ncbi:hypothetical protein SAMN04488085_11451 [Geodermatophilus ruber]|uniref:Uncharacterized protein n=1 Tax=Geodermatophilus ruber TaxID=504800 RepID=A0A1I4J4H9_9ACTN|nr:hypothetical protein SAMN04488085_11451 [Geodermatophilus ruber]
MLLGWLAAVGGSVLLAPGASAAPSETVAIRDLTPPVVSVDAGGSVTFVNQIQDKTVQVGVGPLGLVNVTVQTDVSLRLPSGARALQPGQRVTERFDSSCVTCAITYTYRALSGPGLTDALLGQAIATLPGLPVGVPFVVNTVLPLPNLPSVNLPSPPPITVPLPVPSVAPPVASPTPGPEAPAPGAPAPAPQAPAPTVGGTPYSYDTGGTAVAMSPVDEAVAAAFDPARAGVANRPGLTAGGAAGGSGGVPGTYDGASVPVFGQLAGLNGTMIEEESSDTDVAAAPGGAGQALPLPALVAVVALAGTTAALVRTHLARR